MNTTSGTIVLSDGADGICGINQDNVRLRQCEEVITRGLSTFIDVGNALLTIRDERLYRQQCSTFEEYCQVRWGFSRPRAYQLMEAAEITNALSTIVDKIPGNEGQARTLVPLPEAARAIAWQTIVDTAPGGKVTAKHAEVVARVIEDAISRGALDPGDGIEIPFSDAVKQAITEETYERMKRQENYIAEKKNGKGAHVSNNTGEQEWYTPAEYIEAARRAMGSIDLDPASCEEANMTVQAETYYTKENDGLSLSWFGRVFLNPPYSQPDIAQFSDKLIESLPDIEQACVLVNNASDTKWFQQLIEYSQAICLVGGRVKFIDRNGEPRGAPLQGQVVLYFGDNRTEFRQCFRQFGIILYPADDTRRFWEKVEQPDGRH